MRQLADQAAMLATGEHGEYRWFVGRIADGSLPELVLSCHIGLQLAVSSFDSTALHPNEEEVARGWTVRGDVGLSPPLTGDLDLPHDQFDNIGRFTVVPGEEMQRRCDPSWERDALDWLIPLQKRFWEQLERVRPVSYIATGESDVVVTRNHSFAARLRGAG